ncbi:hypothetical protein Ptr902_02769 [Pyrenophora tritici-repentis]|nr:hypothetical protein Alg130_11371 [Pyrenophora tritici-repentis]KAI0608411.1 hypothetical protein TUN205_07355 [Pyrenophora tritici-repentis]KAI0616243.1 hypothetical protein TUN199_11766 [Pyrenophora tritici-repentis]KAI1666522.1 hypothetical protein L13192_08766 [Pyrenophora tritici-repentis]KAI2483829.1 hypothetical protein Ptr902_02769 [Pyrenophora tritici-repentis]
MRLFTILIMVIPAVLANWCGKEGNTSLGFCIDFCMLEFPDHLNYCIANQCNGC